MSDLDESRTAVTPTVGALSADETLGPRPGQSMIFCARREVHEETGLSIAGHLRSFLRDSRASAAYLGNVWRPVGASQGDDAERGAGLDRFGP